MSDSPYTPPKARIEPPTYSDRREIDRPKEVILAIWLVIAGYLLGRHWFNKRILNEAS